MGNAYFPSIRYVACLKMTKYHVLKQFKNTKGKKVFKRFVACSYHFMIIQSFHGINLSKRQIANTQK